MGNDLVGAILVGPRKLPKHKLTKVRNELKRLKIKIERFDEALQKRCGGRDPAETGDIAEELLDTKRFLGLYDTVARVDALSDSDSYYDALCILRDLLKTSIDTLVNTFVYAWDAGYRTTIDKDLPDSVSKKILVCAVQTWGDPWDNYETNEPGWAISWMDKLGLLSELGIE